MGGFASALGRGLSQAGYAAGEYFGKAALMDIQNEQELERQRRLQEFKEAAEVRSDERKVRLADEEREKSVKRIDAKTGELADEQVGQKRGLIDAGITDRESWTPEQQAAVDQSLAEDKQQLTSDPKLRLKAGAMTGDIKPEKAAELELNERRIEASENAQAARDRAAERRDATQRYIAELRDKQQSARLDALIRAQGGKDAGKDGVREALSFIDGARKELATNEASLREVYKTELKGAELDPDEQKRIKAEYAPKFAAIEKKRTQVEKDFDAMRERVGLPAAAKETPKPDSVVRKPDAAPATLSPKNRPPLSAFERR
jgi:hypothetical protein